MFAERVTPTGTIDDLLAGVPGGGSGVADVATTHGGNRILNAGFAPSWREIRWDPVNRWRVVTPGPIVDTMITGTFWSALAFDHDLASRFHSTRVTPPGNQLGPVRYDFLLTRGQTSTALGSHSSTQMGVDTTGMTCVKVLGSGSCGRFEGGSSYQSRIVLAMTPDGMRGFFALTEVRRHVEVTGPSSPCPDDTFALCTEFDRVEAPTRPTDVYEVDFATGSITHRLTVPGYVFAMAVSEDNKEMVLSEGERRSREHYVWSGATGIDVPVPASFVYEVNTCAVVFRDVVVESSSWGQIHRQVSIRPTTGCSLDPGNVSIGGFGPAIRASW